MWKRDKNKPKRLKKKVSVKERMQIWVNKNKVLLTVLVFFIAFSIFLYLAWIFAPGTDSGIYYNNRTGVL